MDTLTRDEFINSNLPLVHSLANRLRGKGIDYEELYSAGCLGLVKAYDNFEPERGLCFSTYAVPVIMGEMKRLFRDSGSVKVSRGLKELSLKASRAAERLASKGVEPRVSDIAKELGVSCEEAAEALSAAMPAVSLTVEEDGGEADVPQDSGENALIERLALRQCLDELSEEERLLITLRYFRELTQCETARLMGLTQVQVSRRERKILSGIREKLI